MKFKIFKLKFKSPFHFNPGKDSLDKTDKLIQSDTLISALSIAHKKLYGFFPDDFFEPSKVLISSLFPYYKDKLFFPSPIFPFFKMNKDNDRERKKFKKVRFVEKSLWEKIIYGRKIERDISLIYGELYGVENKDASSNSFFIIEDIQRLGDDPFFFSQVRIVDNGGLFFIAKLTDDENLLKRFEASLNFLGDEGIGGDRTVGKGLFAVESVSDIEINHPEESDYWITLSFYIPEEKEFSSIEIEKSYYILKHKTGWFTAYKYFNLRKRSIYGFSEGSVFYSQKSPKGKVVELLKKEEVVFGNGEKNEFSVWRSGLFLGFPIRIGGENGEEI